MLRVQDRRNWRGLSVKKWQDRSYNILPSFRNVALRTGIEKLSGRDTNQGWGIGNIMREGEGLLELMDVAEERPEERKERL